MIKIASLSVAGALLAFGLSAAPAQAGPHRTWVSPMGTDSGACTRAAPCRSFAFELTQTAAGSEIDVLDPAGYGMVTIAKAISIVNDGAGAATIRTSSGNGVTITAGAGDSVHLRGLTIEGLGSGTNGIQFNTGGNLAIENCVIRKFANRGINISPSPSSSFSVSNTIASNPGNIGIFVQPTGAAAVTGPGRAFGGHGEEYGSCQVRRHSIQRRRQRHRWKHEHNTGVLTPSPCINEPSAPAETAGVPEPGRTRLSRSADDFGVADLLGFVKF